MRRGRCIILWLGFFAVAWTLLGADASRRGDGQPGGETAVDAGGAMMAPAPAHTPAAAGRPATSTAAATAAESVAAATVPPAAPVGPARSWGRFGVGGLALVALLLGPGLAWWGWRGGATVALGWVPVPGLLGAATIGLVLWVTGTAKTAVAEWLVAAWGLVGAGGVVVGLVSAYRRRAWAAVGLAGIYVAGVAIAQLLWLVPAPIATEIWPDTPLRGRMVASPPDHVIPFFTAAYMHHGKDGKTSRQEYFGVEWAITSRGPLAPLVLNTGFTLMREHMHDPVAMPGQRWPADEEGFWIARLFGAGMNGLVVLGLLPLLAALGVTQEARFRLGAALCLLAPVTVLHTGFLWPKLLAAYFGCLALADALAGRSAWRIGLWLALAYLAHPVGGLLWPAVLVLAAWPAVATAWREGGGAWGRAVGAGARLFTALVLPLLPWLLYQRWINHPELLWNYPLGDGREWLPAESWRTWWLCRWHNICRTFLPLCFYLSDHARHYGNGLIEGWLRWSLQAQFALTGALGAGLYGAWVAALLGWRKAVWLKVADTPAAGLGARAAAARAWAVVGGTVVVMLLYWGYGGGGLGRDCLQPVTIWMLALVAAHPFCARPWLGRALLGLTALESAVVLGAGFFAR